MKHYRLIAVSALLLLLSACATTTKPIRAEFEDIPVPKGMSYVEDRSTIIESPRVKAARLLYRGPIEVGSLVTAMRTTVEANGWRHISSSKAEDRGTIQVYDKDGASLEIRYWEGFHWRPITYLELTTSRALQAGAFVPTQAQTAVPAPPPQR